MMWHLPIRHHLSQKKPGEKERRDVLSCLAIGWRSGGASQLRWFTASICHEKLVLQMISGRDGLSKSTENGNNMVSESDRLGR